MYFLGWAGISLFFRSSEDALNTSSKESKDSAYFSHPIPILERNFYGVQSVGIIRSYPGGG